MEEALLDDGLTLMLVGMGTVFFFLTVLVLAMILLAGISTRFTPATSAEGVSEEEVAAITAAIKQHTKNNSAR